MAGRGIALGLRGSIGFGARHLEAGMCQWGQAMQRDLVDGAR